MNIDRKLKINGETSLGELVPIVLWENQNPTSAFAYQIVNLSTSDFNYYEIIFLIYTGLSTTKSTGKIPKTYSAYMDYIGGNNQLIGFTRTAEIVNNTIQITDAIRNNTNAVDNTRCIPIQIIGYK